MTGLNIGLLLVTRRPRLAADALARAHTLGPVVAIGHNIEAGGFETIRGSFVDVFNHGLEIAQGLGWSHVAKFDDHDHYPDNYLDQVALRDAPALGRVDRSISCYGQPLPGRAAVGFGTFPTGWRADHDPTGRIGPSVGRRHKFDVAGGIIRACGDWSWNDPAPGQIPNCHSDETGVALW